MLLRQRVGEAAEGLNPLTRRKRLRRVESLSSIPRKNAGLSLAGAPPLLLKRVWSIVCQLRDCFLFSSIIN